MRKNYFIKKGLQTRFISTVFLIIALVIVIMSCNLYFFGLFLGQDDKDGNYSKAVEQLQVDIKEKLADKLILLVLVNVVIVAMISLFFSHQIAGPIYKLEKTLAQINEGHLNVKFYFRQSDKLDELAELLNSVKDKLVVPLKASKELNDKTNAILKEAVDKKDAKFNEDAIKKLSEMHGLFALNYNELKFDDPDNSYQPENAPAEEVQNS